MAVGLLWRSCVLGANFPNDFEAHLSAVDALRNPDEPRYDATADGYGLLSSDNTARHHSTITG